MIWPFRKAEVRETSYTRLLISHLQSSSDGSRSDIAATAVIETAAGYYGRAFNLAEVSPAGIRTAGITPGLLGMIARELIRSGACVLVPEVSRNTVSLLPASDWDVTGGPNPESWNYRVTLNGPTRIYQRRLPAEGVLHFQYAQNPGQPWRSLGPVEAASLTSSLTANLELRLGEEMRSRAGHLLPIAGDPGDSRFDDLKADLGNLRGNTAMVPLLGGGELGPGGAASTRREWEPIRFGADPPASLNQIRSTAGRSILAACGVPVSLADPDASAGGLREAMRQFLHLGVSPLGAVIASEFSRKLELPGFALGFRRLHAADIQGRARAFGSLVNAGSRDTPPIDAERAARITGLED